MNGNKKISDYSFRELLIAAIALAFACFHLWTACTGPLMAVYQRGVHFMFASTLLFLMVPTKTKFKSVNLFVDVVFLACSILPIVYLLLNEQWLINRFFYIEEFKAYQYLLCAMMIVAILESTRRKLGKALPIIAMIAMGYMLFGKYLPGAFGNGGFSTIAFVDTLYTTTEGVFGSALGASATYVILFIIFGSFLEASGVGDYFINVAMLLTRRSKGGPAKASVISSALFGSISGSAIANVATTGQITIPIMKKSGYDSDYAGAVEAVASTGGQIMPPVMGAVAFIMSEYTGIAYVKILKAALVPALLYYTAVFLMVHLEADRLGLEPQSKSKMTSAERNLLISGAYLFIPLIVLVGGLVMGYSATYACLFSMISVIVVSMFKKETRLTPAKIIQCLINGAKGCVGVALACACSGIVVGIINYTGVGTRLSSALVTLSGNSVYLALLLTAVSCLILGMGLPSVPAYIVVATLLVPCLVKMGVSLMGAHLFAFYYSSIANITPPVALAAYTAAGLSGGSPMKTGYKAFGLGMAAYIVPFMFAINPALLLDSSINIIILIQGVITAFAGVTCLAASVEGQLLGKLKMYQRVLLIIACLLMVYTGTLTDIIGLICACIVLIPRIVSKKNTNEKVIK